MNPPERQKIQTFIERIDETLQRISPYASHELRGESQEAALHLLLLIVLGDKRRSLVTTLKDWQGYFSSEFAPRYDHGSKEQGEAVARLEGFVSNLREFFDISSEMIDLMELKGSRDPEAVIREAYANSSRIASRGIDVVNDMLAGDDKVAVLEWDIFSAIVQFAFFYTDDADGIDRQRFIKYLISKVPLS